MDNTLNKRTLSFTISPVVTLMLLLAQVALLVPKAFGSTLDWIWIFLPSTILGGIFMTLTVALFVKVVLQK